MLHKLKIEKRDADLILSGDKTFDIRKNDRDYRVGDEIEFAVLSDVTNYVDYFHKLTGEIYEITYIYSKLGMVYDYVVLGFKKAERVTEYNEQNEISIKNIPNLISTLQHALNKLYEYENIGYTPDALAELEKDYDYMADKVDEAKRKMEKISDWLENAGFENMSRAIEQEWDL